MAYDEKSDEAILGNKGARRALRMCQQRLKKRKSRIVVRVGPKHPGANGRLGDLLFHLPDEAPLATIEVKTSTARYPDSVSISKFEVLNSRARWLMALNEDESLGCWFQTWSNAMAHLTERVSYREGHRKVYYTSHPQVGTRVSFDDVLDEIQRIFGEI